MNHKAKISIDDTDFHIADQTPFDNMRYSHKFKGHGLRYEVVICILMGLIVWIIGGYSCGAYPDLRILERFYLIF